MTFQVHLSLWETGTALTNIWNSFFATSHLYNMASHEGRLNAAVEWPDLEYLITLHGEKHLFCGGRPAKATEY